MKLSAPGVARSLGSALSASFIAPRTARRRPHGRRAGVAVAAALAGACLLAVPGTPAASASTAGVAVRAGSGSGFSFPFGGPARFESLAPRKAVTASQVNQPLGAREAEAIAQRMGLSRATSLTHQQYLEFVSGKGIGGDTTPAKLVDASVAILTNTTGRPLISLVDGVPTPSVLASYGVFVNPQGQLESPANADAATRKVNTVIQPGGYMGTWMRANGATKSLITLYRSAYTVEAAYGFLAQQQSGAAQLVTNTKGRVSSEVGMSMAPALWLTNFALIYTLNPDLAAYMPAFWTPLPDAVANAILASPTGQVPYSQVRNAFS